MKKDYFITKKSKRDGNYYLEMICCSDEQQAKQTLEKISKEHPENSYRLESEDRENCWWNQGSLD